MSRDRPRPSRGPGRYTRAEKRIQVAKALELFLAGAQDDTIASELGVHPETARRRYRQGLEEMRPVADVDRYRARQIAENEFRRRKLMRGITIAASERNWSALSSLNRTLTQLHEREARALNLDKAPHWADEIANMSDAELERLVQQAEAENPDAAEAVAEQ